MSHMPIGIVGDRSASKRGDDAEMFIQQNNARHTCMGKKKSGTDWAENELIPDLSL